ncbi:carboxypeptidase family protein [Homoserinimonas aerilata]|uniref:Carboxypeptidase family protein n=2 Tax=Homoserinimonas aerilata TaxID=1162970 RepID=A0A542YGY3_9MICO|nr:carboxypeptidase family protein [Homoserinimonas aerilata]
MMSALALVGAAPAVAAGERYVIAGTVNTPDGTGAFVPLDGVEASVSFTEPGSSGSRYSTTSVADGTFEFTSVGNSFPAGGYTVEFALEGYCTVSVPAVIVDQNVTLAPVTLFPLMVPGTVTISGDPVVGTVLTASTSACR